MGSIDTGGAAFPSPGVVVGHAGLRQQGAYEGMTLRQYAAIKLRVPNSGIDWLDDMIRASQRDEFAGMAMQGLMADPNTMVDEDAIAAICYRVADGMLAARQKSGSA